MDSIATPFNCYIVGETSLVIQCADVLIKQGHRIKGVISPDPQIEAWAFSQYIPWFGSLNLAEDTLVNTSFDYLFSIINNQVLSNIVLNTPQKFAINYHDSPLPRYAGVNATCWSILNDEKHHAITWHMITDLIDGGDILKQISFDIEANETAFSLNLKCYQQAIIGFSELVKELTHNTYQRIVQSLGNRTYFGFSKKPEGNGWISWHAPAEQIERLCRALRFGQYTNKLSSAKLVINQQMYWVDKVQILAKKTDAPPGTLIDLQPNYWIITTATMDLQLIDLGCDAVIRCDLDQVAEAHQLKPGDRLFSPSMEDLQRVEQVGQTYFKYEPFWVQSCLTFQPAQLYFIPTLSLQHHDDVFCCVQRIDLPPSIGLDRERSTCLLAVWLIYLYRLGNHENLGIHIDLNQEHDLPKEARSFVSKFVPFDMQLHADLLFNDVVKLVGEKRLLMEKNGSFMSDLMRRYPTLEVDKKAAQVGVIISDIMSDTLWNLNAHHAVVCVIHPEGNSIAFFVNHGLLQAEPSLQIDLERIPEHFHVLFHACTQTQDTPIGYMPLLTLSEQDHLLSVWNQTARSYPNEKTIHALFEEQAEKYPNQPAVCFEGQCLTYLQLNQRANDLACYIRGRYQSEHAVALPNDTIIAVMLSRGIEVYVAFLAILKAGGAFLPLDPDDPIERLAFMLDDSQASYIVTQRAIFNSQGILTARQKYVAMLDEPLEAGYYEPIADHSTPNHLAYIMYTSGTTGQPKGVQVEHKGVVNLVTNTNYVRVNQGDRFIQASKFIFDASTFEIWGALLNGATSYLVEQNVVLHSKLLGQFICENQIDLLYLTAGLFNEIASQDLSVFFNLRHLYVGGEPARSELVKTLIEHPSANGLTVTNGYGPTECTTFSTTYAITSVPNTAYCIPIGGPIAGVKCYILDEHLQLRPRGMVGELFISGAGVARGYLNQPELTRTKFLPNLFSVDDPDHRRIYRTGDLARYLTDGRIELMGRIDKQVKLRGYRIELDGIESVLSVHPAIKRCVITTNADERKCLVAYYVVHEGVDVIQNELVDYLKKQIPAYMIPTFFVPMRRIPLTSNGKVDYNSLPTPQDRLLDSKQTTKPLSEVECKIHKIWQDTLKIQSIGLHDNFFDVGGDSLLLMKLHYQLEQAFQREISLNTLFIQTTISDLTRYFSGSEKKSNPQLMAARARAQKRLNASSPVAQ